MNVTVRGKTRHYRTVSFDSARNAVVLIEQRLLPHEFKLVAMPDFRATAKAITDMVDKPGDSGLTGPGQAPNEKISLKVTAKKGSQLYFMCLIHPWMQAKVQVQ